MDHTMIVEQVMQHCKRLIKNILDCRLSNNFSRLTHKFSPAFEQLRGENRHALTHIFSVRRAAPFSNDESCANGPFHGTAKNYVSEHNAAKDVHLHDAVKGYVSETDEIFTFPGKLLDTKMVPCCNEKLCGRTNPTPQGANPLHRLTYSQQAENLSVGKTKSYWTNNRCGHPPRTAAAAVSPVACVCGTLCAIDQRGSTVAVYSVWGDRSAPCPERI